MNNNHDLGGRAAGPIDKSEHQPLFWQKRMEAMRDSLAQRKRPIMRVDEMRRGIEELAPNLYNRLDVYGRKTLAIRNVLIEKGVINSTELDLRIAALEEKYQTYREGSTAALGSTQQRSPRASHHGHESSEKGRIAETQDSIDEFELISTAVIDLLIAKQLLTPKELHARIERAEAAGITLGGRIVAHAWCDARFREHLLSDAKQALADFGVEALEAQIIVTENTARLHNLIVCTLCSCYPRSILGSPPTWYVSDAYRARAVREPRTLLSEFGTDLPADVEVRVHDSTADMRYMVLPMRPAGTEGWTEASLAKIVTRDCLIGVTPAQLASQRVHPRV